jgi:hypothetical protein
MTRFNYIIPGIFDTVDDPRMWDYQAQLWMHEHGQGLAAGFNYYTDIIGGVLARETFARMVASDLLAAQKAGLSIRVICHSNGAGIICDALTGFPNLILDELHLIAAAIEDNCDKNGLNLAATEKQVGRIVGYVSSRDEVLGLGPLISYGDFGKIGPTNLSPALAGIYSQLNRECGHSDWVYRDFESTMEAICANSAKSAFQKGQT